MKNAMVIEDNSFENEDINEIDYERDELLNQLKAFLASFEESDDLFEKVSHKFISLEQEYHYNNIDYIIFYKKSKSMSKG